MRICYYMVDYLNICIWNQSVYINNQSPLCEHGHWHHGMQIALFQTNTPSICPIYSMLSAKVLDFPRWYHARGAQYCAIDIAYAMTPPSIYLHIYLPDIARQESQDFRAKNDTSFSFCTPKNNQFGTTTCKGVYLEKRTKTELGDRCSHRLFFNGIQ